jgi:hypothetical protein
MSMGRAPSATVLTDIVWMIRAMGGGYVHIAGERINREAQGTALIS